MVSTRGGTYDISTANIATISEAPQGKRPQNKQPELEKTKEVKIKSLGPEFEHKREESPTPESQVGVVQHEPMENP